MEAALQVEAATRAEMLRAWQALTEAIRTEQVTRETSAQTEMTAAQTEKEAEALAARREADERVEAAIAHWEAARTELGAARARWEAARARWEAARARALAPSVRETISRIETQEEIEAKCRHCVPGDPEYACDDVIDMEPLKAPVYINTTTRQCYNEDGVIKIIKGNHPNPAPDPLSRVLWNVPNELSIRTKPPTPLV